MASRYGGLISEACVVRQAHDPFVVRSISCVSTPYRLMSIQDSHPTGSFIWSFLPVNKCWLCEAQLLLGRQQLLRVFTPTLEQYHHDIKSTATMAPITFFLPLLPQWRLPRRVPPWVMSKKPPVLFCQYPHRRLTQHLSCFAILT